MNKNRCFFCVSDSNIVFSHNEYSVCYNCIINFYNEIKNLIGKEPQIPKKWVFFTVTEANYLIMKCGLAPRTFPNNPRKIEKILGKDYQTIENNVQNKLQSIGEIYLSLQQTQLPGHEKFQVCDFCGERSKDTLVKDRNSICYSCVIKAFNKIKGQIEPESPIPPPGHVVLNNLQVRYLVVRYNLLPTLFSKSEEELKNFFKMNYNLMECFEKDIYQSLTSFNQTIDTSTLSEEQKKNICCTLCGKLSDIIYVGDEYGYLCSTCRDKFEQEAKHHERNESLP